MKDAVNVSLRTSLSFHFARIGECVDEWPILSLHRKRRQSRRFPPRTNGEQPVPVRRSVDGSIDERCEEEDLSRLWIDLSLLEDENGMEWLVANKIINLNLSVRDVYKKVWLPSLPPAPPVTPASSKQQAMHVIYRMRGLLGDATEDIIERLDTKTNDTRQGKDEDEENPEDIFSSRQCSRWTSRIRSDVQTVEFHRRSFVECWTKSLFYSFVAIRIRHPTGIEPRTSDRSSITNDRVSLSTTSCRRQRTTRFDVASLVDRTLSFSSQSMLSSRFTTPFSSVSALRTVLSSLFVQRRRSRKEKIHSLFDSLQFSFVQSHPTLLQGLLRLLSSFHSSLQFDRFDVEQKPEQEFHLTCFTDICQQHLEKKHSSILDQSLRWIFEDRQDGGVIDQAIH